ncbi:hypothetical protein BGY98DRAFT_933326 [Russula aff. rugulosa BPL654]|nr:hypothetical protein BGY98DRAFT_933326 [Russula aff. rugulosa BPL654]
MTPLTEERFMDAFMLFSNLTGIRLNEQDFFIDGNQVTMNGEWSMVGVDLGFRPVSCGNPHLLAQCTPAVAHQLHQLYQDTLRHFDQAYTRGTINQLETFPSPTSSSAMTLPTIGISTYGIRLPGALATIAASESSSVMTFDDAKNVLLRFCDVSGAELEAHRVPQNVQRRSDWESMHGGPMNLYQAELLEEGVALTPSGCTWLTWCAISRIGVTAVAGPPSPPLFVRREFLGPPSRISCAYVGCDYTQSRSSRSSSSARAKTKVLGNQKETDLSKESTKSVHA